MSRAAKSQSPQASRRHEPGLLPDLPYPLDVHIRETPHEVLHVSAGARDVTVCVAECPDGCGQLVAWTETILPFNAATPDAVAAIIVGSYPEVTA
jgi:hypothetical protein